MGVADTLYPMRYVEAGEVPGPEGASWAEAGLKRNELLSVFPLPWKIMPG